MFFDNILNCKMDIDGGIFGQFAENAVKKTWKIRKNMNFRESAEESYTNNSEFKHCTDK